MRILVTGGLGYLGGRVSNAFSNLGHEVTITTRKSNRSFANNSSLKFTNPDWGSESELFSICAEMDLIIHAAGVNAAACELDPCFALEFNGNATGRLIRAAEKSEVKSFVYLSTAHVYANPLVGYIDENTAPSNSHPYATSHLAGELKVLERGSQSKSKMKRHVVRLSNVYGSPNTLLTDCWNLFINDIAKQIAMNKSILLRSDPSHERDFLAMGDFLNLMIGFTLEDKDNLLPSLINFGSGSAMSLIDVANKVSEIAVDVFGFRPPILNNPSKLVKEKTSFQYATKFKTISDRYRSNSMEKEIKQLLKFTKNNFGQDFYGG